MMSSHIAVVGLMGVGKTTLAALLAERFDRPLADGDEQLERFVGVHGVTVASVLGVDALHQIERAVLLASLAQPDPQIIAPAASVVEDPLARKLLALVPVVRVTASVDLVHSRQSSGSHRRPMALPELRAVEQRRAPLFAQIEDVVVSSDQPIEDMVSQAIEGLRTLSSRTTQSEQNHQ